jgi:hypothetical protein
VSEVKVRICRHCKDGDKPVNRPRGLCWTCYYTPGVKALYPSTSKFAVRGVGNGQRFRIKLDSAPTMAVPGSIEKVEVMEDRAKRGVAIFHPVDARFRGDPRTRQFLEGKNAATTTPSTHLKRRRNWCPKRLRVPETPARLRGFEARGLVLAGRSDRASLTEESFNGIEVPSGGGEV